MKMLEKHPLGAFASFFYIFSCVVLSVDRDVRSFIIVFALAVFAAVIFIREKLDGHGIRRAAMAVSAALLAASLFSGIVIDVKIARIESETHSGVPVKGVVQSVVFNSPYSGCYKVKPYEDVFGDEVKLLLYCDNGEIRIGDRIECVADVFPAERYGDDYSRYADGVVLEAEAVSEVEVIGKSYDIETKLSVLREKLASKFTSEMSDDTGGFAAALVLGDRSSLPGSISRDFRTLGISHILALSGTHLTVLFAIASKCIPTRGKLRYVRSFVVILGVLFYMALTGFPSSVVRSGIMFIIASIADFLNKETDSFTSLSAAVLIICLMNPYAPFDMGLQLSYTSVVGLIISGGIAKRISEGGSRSRKIFACVLPAFAVPAIVLPQSWLRFGSVSLASPLANLIVVPVITVLIPILAVTLLISLISIVFLPVVSVIDVVISFILGIIRRVAESFDYTLPLQGDLVAVFVILFAVFCAGALLFRGNCRRVLGCMTVAMLFCIVLTAQIHNIGRENGATVYYSSSGTDDALSVVNDGYSMLVDTGQYPSAIKNAAKMSVGYGGKINSVVLTHLHRSHCSVLSELCDNFYLDNLWIPVPSGKGSWEVYNGIASEAKRLGVEVYSYIPGETFNIGECELSSDMKWISGSEHPTVKVSVEYGENGLIYGGSRTEIPSTPDGWVRVMGVHGHKGKGTLSDVSANTVISPACAASFDSVCGSVSVMDKAVIKLGEGFSVTSYQE